MRMPDNGKQAVRTRVLNGLYLLFCLLALVRYFVPALSLDIPLACLLALLAVIPFPRLARGSKIIFSILGLLGVVCMVLCRASFPQWIEAILSNALLIALLLTVPFLSAPFHYDDYQTRLSLFVRRNMRGMMGFLILAGLVNYLLSVCIGVGAIMVTYTLLSPYAKLYDGDEPFMITMSRSYNASGFLSPAWASIAVFSAVQGSSWIRALPAAALFTVLFLLLHYGSLFLETRVHPARYHGILESVPSAPKDGKMRALLLLLGGMLLSIVLVNVCTGWDLMVCVVLCSFLFPIAAAFCMHKPEGFRRGLDLYLGSQLPESYSMASLFLFAGFFGKALSFAGIGDALVKLLPASAATYPPFMIFCLMLLMYLPAMAGVHSAATGSAIIAALTPAQLGLNPYSYILAILSGWLIAIMMCPYSVTALMLSEYSGKSNYHTTIGINKWFSILCLVLFSFLCAWIGPLIG